MRLSRLSPPLRRVLTWGGGALLFVAAFWWIAPYNIAASVSHAPGVAWLLKGYLHNAVRTWSFGAEPPAWIDLDDPAVIARGAGHFETGCAPCHGAPGRSRNPVVHGMRPEPPDLAPHVEQYAPRELWWIAQNGFKYTGMPAWPTQLRPSEPWALAAFLMRYPELDADPAAYRALAYGPVEPLDGWTGEEAITFGGLNARVSSLMRNCARCHGLEGLGRDGVAPVLAGQSEPYLFATLQAYAEWARPSGFMQPIAASLSEEEMRELARRYAAMDPPEPRPAQPALVDEGARLAHLGDASRDVPACVACHGGAGREPARPLHPRLAGQDARWLAEWLRLWREMQLGGTEWANVMHKAARTLTDPQIEALAAYYAAGAPQVEIAARP